VKSSIGLGLLLSEGIGDTIRVSLASDPVDEILADATTSATLSARPILPGLIRKQSAPYSATLSAIL
jgi:4-hydroxy-3-methylbut-2-en-1-yl diphosphate synthase IspG/GcpE